MKLIIIPAALLIYFSFIFWFIKYRYLSRYYAVISRADSSASPYRLARGVRRFLSFSHWLLFIIVIVLLPLYFSVNIYQAGSPDWGADIALHSYFRLNLSMLPDFEISELNRQEIIGWGTLRINTSNYFAWYLLMIWHYLALLSFLYLVLQLRNIFVSLNLGEAFTKKNSIRLNRIAIVLLAWQVAIPLLQLFSFWAVFNGLTLKTQGIRLDPHFEVNLIYITLGLALLVLSGVLNEAVKMRDEQRLTI